MNLLRWLLGKKRYCCCVTAAADTRRTIEVTSWPFVVLATDRDEAMEKANAVLEKLKEEMPHFTSWGVMLQEAVMIDDVSKVVIVSKFQAT